MKRLILMRHAKSDWSFATPDHDRPLNDRGIRSARALGDWLRARDLLPDEALVSTARRNRETWGLLGLDRCARFLPALYHAGPPALWEALATATGDTVLLVGHNPGIAEFAAEMVAEPPRHDRFDDYPTGATLVARFEADGWAAVAPGRAHPETFVVPRELDEP